MRRAVSYFVVGCIISAWFLTPTALVSNSAEAATSLALISGFVKDDTGKPLAGAAVALFEAQPGQIIGGNLLKNMTTDAEGRFKASVAPGFYRLRAAADGFRPTFGVQACRSATAAWRKWCGGCARGPPRREPARARAGCRARG